MQLNNIEIEKYYGKIYIQVKEKYGNIKKERKERDALSC